VLIVADDALKSAAEAGDRISRKVDKEFSKAINLLSSFEKDFSQEPTSDPNIDEKDTRKVKISDESTHPSTILYALKKNLHSKVKFRSVSLPFNTDES
jgi:hypothetical protein